MRLDDNTVNIKTYHHGDLRQALVDAGLQLLRERSADDLALREVARAVGVSATAVYRHFPDKAALLNALAEAGLDGLADVQRSAALRSNGGFAAFNATGVAYVRFALDNPALFRLIFSCSHQHRAADKAEGSAFALLQENAASLVPPDSGPDEARVFALQAWSLVHGLAVLLLDGQIEADDALIRRVVDAAAIRA